MWKEDGAGRRASIGVLTPHLDPVPETELAAMAPAGIAIHAARVPLGMVTDEGEIVSKVDPGIAAAFARPPHVDRAARALASLDLTAIVYAFTSSSYILGATADNDLAARLEAAAGGIPVVIQCQALVAALRAVGATHAALAHPPWFSAELDALGVRYFEARGFRVTGLGPSAVRTDYGDLEPARVFDWMSLHMPIGAEALVIGGGGFRAVGVIDALERALGRPVLSANQATFWLALRRSGIADAIPGYGRLLTLPGPA